MELFQLNTVKERLSSGELHVGKDEVEEDGNNNEHEVFLSELRSDDPKQVFFFWRYSEESKSVDSV